MKSMKTAAFLLLLAMVTRLHAQTLYVDPAKGKDDNSGALAAPLATLPRAVAMAKQFDGRQPITIRLAPGLYQLTQLLTIGSGEGRNDSSRYTLEAMTMPDDKDWTPSTTPVISSISPDNDQKYFVHCGGIMVARANTCLRGLKFIGNPNPAVDYYYPILRDSLILNTLDISQCYFIGDRYGAVVQGAIYAEGPGIHVDHCLFYGCKNAVLVFEKVKDFSVTHTIIYGAYEGAVWFGFREPDEPFVFSDNIVSHCRYFWSSSKGFDHSTYKFSHSLICENDNYVGEQNGEGGVIPLKDPVTFHEDGIRKTGAVKLIEVGVEGLPRNYLHLAPQSDGQDIQAGVFTR